MANPIRNEFTLTSLEGVMSVGEERAPHLCPNILKHLSPKDLRSLKLASFTLRNVTLHSQEAYYQNLLNTLFETTPDILQMAKDYFNKIHPEAALPNYQEIYKICYDFLYQFCRQNPQNDQVKLYPHSYSESNMAQMRDLLIQNHKEYLLYILDHPRHLLMDILLYCFRHDISPENYQDYEEFKLAFTNHLANNDFFDLMLFHLPMTSLPRKKNIFLFNYKIHLIKKLSIDQIFSYFDKFKNLPNSPTDNLLIEQFKKTIRSLFYQEQNFTNSLSALSKGPELDEALRSNGISTYAFFQPEQALKILDSITSFELKASISRQIAKKYIIEGRYEELEKLFPDKDFQSLKRNIELRQKCDRSYHAGEIKKAFKYLYQIDDEDEFFSTIIAQIPRMKPKISKLLKIRSRSTALAPRFTSDEVQSRTQLIEPFNKRVKYGLVLFAIAISMFVILTQRSFR